MQKPWFSREKLFVVYIAAALYLLFVFFTIGYIAIRHLTLVDAIGLKGNPLEQYAPWGSYGIWTMTPLYILSVLEMGLLIFFSTFGFLKRPNFIFKVIMLFLVLEGLSLWFYAIL